MKHAFKRLAIIRNTIPMLNASPFAAPEGCADLDPLVNALPLETAADWMEVPYADVPNLHAGKPVVQRLDKPAAEAMVALFNSWRGKLARLFGGLPFFVGHPDATAFANQDRDKKAYGWIKDLEAGEAGLRVRVDWSAPGAELVNNAHYKFWSPFFLGRPNGQKDAEGTPIYTPVWLKSAGLTNNPRWPVAPLANEDTETGAPENDDMNLLQRLLGAIGFANDKTEEEALAHVTTMQAAFAELTNQGEELTAERDRLIAQRDAMRATAAAELVNAAIVAGRVLPADHEAALVPFVNAADPDAFAAAAAQLARLPQALKTVAVAAADPQLDSNLRQRQDQIIALVNARMEKTNAAYDQAFAWVRKNHGALFAPATGEE